MLNFNDIAKRVGKLAIDNSPVILTGLAVAGTVTTAYLTGKATIKAFEFVRDEEDAQQSVLYPKDRIRFVFENGYWRLYIPAVGTGVMTVACMVAATRIGARRAAALAAAYSLGERALEEYKAKVVEKIGEGKERAVRDEIAQDQVTRDPANNRQVIIAGGDVLCFEAYTGRYFRSSVELLKKAQNDLNYQVNNNYYASLTDFYNLVGLPKTAVSDEMGWNTDKLLELEFSTTLSADGQPCISINFLVTPVRGYSRLN